MLFSIYTVISQMVWFNCVQFQLDKNGHIMFNSLGKLYHVWDRDGIRENFLKIQIMLPTHVKNDHLGPLMQFWKEIKGFQNFSPNTKLTFKIFSPTPNLAHSAIRLLNVTRILLAYSTVQIFRPPQNRPKLFAHFELSVQNHLPTQPDASPSHK